MTSPLMRRRELLALGLGALASCVPPYAVVRQSSTNPFRGQRRFSLLPLDLSETAYALWRPTQADLEARDVHSQTTHDPQELDERYAGALAGFFAEFKRGLVGTLSSSINVVEAGQVPDAEAFTIQVALPFVDPGLLTTDFQHGVRYSAPSRVVARVRFAAPHATERDEIEIHTSSIPQAVFWQGGRLGHDGLMCGRSAAGHLASRIDG